MSGSFLVRAPWRWLLGAIWLVSSSAALASGATSQREINPTGGVAADGSDGLRVWTGSNSQFQVNLGNQGQVYSSGGRPTGGTLFNSVYLRVDRGSNGTTRIYSDANNAASPPFLRFTQVSQSAISGAGTAASPWQVTTVLRPSYSSDSGITVTIVDSYVRPQAWFTRRVNLTGMPASGAVIKFYQNIDTYLLGGDNGPGFTRTSSWNTTGIPDFVGVQKNDQFEALWHEPSSGTPLWNRYFSGQYTWPGAQICNGTNALSNPCTTGTGDLSNAINTNPSTDNGIAAQWNIPAGASSHALEYRVTFGSASADLTKAFAPGTINAGGVSTLTFTLTNRTVNSVASINFTDTLPTGVTVAPTPNVRTSCPAGGALGGTLPGGMTVTAAPGSGSIQVTGASINGAPVSGQLSCVVAVNVTSSVVGDHVNGPGNITGLNNLLNLVGNEVLTVIQPPSQLSASKSVSGTLVAGQTGVAADGHYLIQLTNTGAGPTSGAITLVDTLPAGVTAVAASSAQGAVACGGLPSGGTVTCTFTPAAPIAPSGTATVRINVAIDPNATGSVTNTVAVAGGGDPDPLPTCPAPGNAQCAQVTTPLSASADLAVVKSVSNPTPLVGSTLTFTIALSNNGPSAAQGVTVNDPLPPGYTYVSDTPSAGTYNAGTGVWTVGTLAAGGSATLSIVVTVNASGPYANTASASSGTSDPTPGNNTSTSTPTPIPLADVSVSKAFVPDVVFTGGSSQLTITLSNPNPVPAILTADLVDNLPAGLVLAAPPNLSTTCAGGAGVSGTAGGGTLTLGSGAAIPAGAPGTCTIAADVIGSAPGVHTNVIPAGALQTSLGNNPAPGQADLVVSYDFCPADTGGTSPIFSITNGVNIWAYMPPGATPDVLLPISASIPNDLNALMIDPVRNRALFIQRAGGNSVLWAYDVANGGWYQAAVPVATPDFPRGGMTSTGVGYLVAGNSATPQVWRVDADPGDPSGFLYTLAQVPGTLTYDFAPTNLSSGDIAFDSAGNGWLSAGVDLYRVDMTTLVATRQIRPLLGGAPSTINWAGIAFGDDGTLYVADNTAGSAYYAYDPTTGDLNHVVDTTAGGSRDLASCAFPVPTAPILSVEKTLYQINGAAPGPLAYPGDLLTYAIEISNTGNAVATLYPDDVVETVPADATHEAGDDFTCAAPTAGSSCGNTAAVNVVAGNSVTLYFSVRLTTPVLGTQISNTMAIPDFIDCGVAPNDCSETTPVGPFVSLTKTLQTGGSTAEAGETLVYTLTLTNASGTGTTYPAGALGETVPANTTHAGGDDFTCATPGAGSACSNTAAITVPGNGSVTLTFQVTVTDPIPAGVTEIANTATPPAGATCASCAVTTPVADPDVSLTKSLQTGGPTAEAGETLVYALTLTNASGTGATYPAGALGETVPANTTHAGGDDFTCATPGAGSACSNTAAITVPGNGSVTLAFRVTVADPIPAGVTQIANTATPPAGATCADCAVTTPTEGRVTLVKALNAEGGSQPGMAEPGEQLTYTITLSNDGGSEVAGYGVTDELDANTVFVSADNGGNHAGGVVIWSGLTVPASGSLVLTVVVTVADPIPDGVTTISNIAYETGETPPACPDPQCATIPTEGRVAMTKSLSAEGGTEPGIAEPGEQLTYTITLSNDGGSDVTGYGVTDQLDPNTVFVSADNGGSHAGGVVTWSSLTVPASGDLVLTVVVTVADPIPDGVTEIANIAYETGETPPACPDPQCATIPTEGRVTLVKALDAEGGSQPGIAEPGEQLTYTITLSNDGGSDVTGYGVIDELDANTVFVSADNGGNHAGGVVTWSGLTVPASGSLVLTVVVTVADPIPDGVTEIANIAYETGETPPACPDPQCATIPTAGRVALVKAISDEDGNVAGVAEPGEQLTYTITLSNDGGSDVTGYGVTDQLDANTVFVSADNGGSHVGGVVIWSGLTVPASGSLVLTVVVTVADPIPDGVTAIANVAYETGTIPPSCPPVGSHCVLIPTDASISVGKALSGESIEPDGIAEPGEELAYTITVWNQGGTDELNVVVNETVPAHTVFVGGAPTWTCVPGDPPATACETLVDVPAHDGVNPGIATLTFTVRVDDPLASDATAISNAVALNDGTPPDCAVSPGDPACELTPTINVDLAKSVVGITPTGPATYRIEYAINVVNLGGADATYTLDDVLSFPAGVVFTGNGQVSTSDGTLNPALTGGLFAPVNGSPVQLSANGVTLAVGQTHEYRVLVPVGIQSGGLQDGDCTGQPGHGLYNQALISGSFDLETSACASISGDVPLIRLTKQVELGVDNNNDHYGDVGDVLHYSFTIENPGVLPLSAVQLVDPRVSDLQCDPVTANGEPFYVFRGDEVFDDAFEGRPRGGVLVPGDSIGCTATYTLTAQDVARRRVINSATASGVASDGRAVTSTSTAIFAMFR